MLEPVTLTPDTEMVPDEYFAGLGSPGSPSTVTVRQIFPAGQSEASIGDPAGRAGQASPVLETGPLTTVE